MSSVNPFWHVVQDEAQESRMRAAGVADDVRSTHGRRCGNYESYLAATDQFKSSKDLTAFVARRKKADSDHRQLTAHITHLQQVLKADSVDVSDKVGLGLPAQAELTAYRTLSVLLTIWQYWMSRKCHDWDVTGWSAWGIIPCLSS